MTPNTNSFGPLLETLLFQTLPYLVAVLFFVATIYRYRSQKFTYSSLSSQFLENRHHFWGSVPFHYGILVLFGGHLIGFLFPRQVLLWGSVAESMDVVQVGDQVLWSAPMPVRVAIIELAAFIFALLTLVGLINIMVRRFTDSKARMVTSTLDWIVYALLLWQVVSGLWVAVFHSWGIAWYAASAAPYLRSLVVFQPDLSYITPLPWMAKLHIVGATLVFAIFPFSRLVHILVVPNPYIWRKWQMVRWYWDRRSIRRAE